VRFDHPLDGMNEPQLSFLEHLPLTREAVRYAERQHGRQRRAADDASYVLHLLEVASLLERSGYPDRVVAAAVLHDVLEDTDAERSELDARFGWEVGELVALVTDDPAIAQEEARKDDVRERVRRAGNEALAVYAADKVAKVRELRMLIARGADERGIEARKRRYEKSLAMIEEQTPGNRLARLLRFELEALEELPPERGSALRPSRE
jgi:(p)ppGpp synthase/HD superfamily hydrolase